MANEGLFESSIAVITGAFITVVLIRYVGEALDRVTTAFANAGMMDVSSKWVGSADTMFDLFYLACYVPFLLTLIYAYMNVRRKHTETPTTGFGFEDNYY